MISNSEKINDFIYSLEYDPTKLMCFQGDDITNYAKKEGAFENDDFIVTKRTLNEISGEYDVSVPNAYRSTTYPGSLLVANQDLVDNMPNPIGVKRGPVKLTIDLPGLNGVENHAMIQSTDYSNVLGGIDKMLSDWYDKKVEIPAVISCKKDMIYDEKSLELRYGGAIGLLKDKMNIKFEAIANNKSAASIFRFTQIFYTASVSPFNNPSDAFHESVTVEDLMNKGINNKNPLAYVQNVQYGRELYLVFEADMSSQKLEACINGGLTIPETGGTMNVAVDDKAELKHLHKDIKYTLITVGGKSNVFSGKFDDKDMVGQINDLISQNMKLSAENPAYPLVYTPVFLKNNEIICINGVTEYITTESTRYSSGQITLNHKGAFVAKFHVSWDETSYNERSEKTTKRCRWSENDKNLTAGFSSPIALKGNASNISIKCEGKTGLVWEKWRTNLDKRDIPLSKNALVEIWGTTLNQKSKISYDG